MANRFLDIENKEDAAEQIAALIGWASKFKYTAAEWNLIVEKINELHTILSDTDLATNFYNNILPKFKSLGFVQGDLSQIAALVNALPNFDITGNERYYFVTKKSVVSGNSSGLEIPSPSGGSIYFDLVTTYYTFLPGKGNYGQNGTPISAADLRKFPVEETTQSNVPLIFNLGEIGDTASIESIVNGSGPYGVSEGTTVLFKATRSTVPYKWFWQGEKATVGTGYPATIATDYLLLNDIAPQPSHSGSSVSTSALDATLYDDLIFKTANTLPDFTALTENLYLLQTLNDGKFYFASKQTNKEDFVGSRIFLRESATKHDLEAPTSSANGYDYRELKGLPSVFSDGVDYAFQAWFDIVDDVEVKKLITYSPQTPTPAQQAQAQQNIGIELPTVTFTDTAAELTNDLIF